MSTIISGTASSAIFLGETIRFYVTGVTDLNGNPITAPTTVQVDLIRATDGSHASGFPTTTGYVYDGNAQFHYDYNVGTTDIIGQWSVLWKITNGSYVNESACNFAVNLFNGSLVLTQQPSIPPLVLAYVLQPLATDPLAPQVGQLWLNTTTNTVKYNSTNGVVSLKVLSAQWNTISGYKPSALVSPNGPTDGGDFGPNSLLGGSVGQAGPPFSPTQGLQEAITTVTNLANSGVIDIVGGGAPYDMTTNQLIIPNNVPLKIRGVGPITQSGTSPPGFPTPIIAYGGTDWLLKTNGSAPTDYNSYFDIENLVFSLYGGAYKGGLNALNLPMQIKGNVEVADYAASNSNYVASSIGVKWDYSTGSGSNGFELLNDNLFVNGFDTQVIVNVDHFQIQKMHLLYGRTAQLQIGTTSYYPLNPTFGDLHLVAGKNNTVTSGISIPLTAGSGGISIETWLSNIYFEAVSGGAYTSHLNIQAPVRADRGFTIGMLHNGTITVNGNYQHINALSRDGMANSQFGFGYSSPSVPGTSSFTNTNYYSVSIYQTGSLGGTLTITDLKGNAITVGTPSVFTLAPGESGQFSSSGPSTWKWYANIN